MSEPESPTPISPEALESIKVDWVAQLQQGGITAIVLGVIAVALVAFMLERFFNLRRGNVAPKKLVKIATQRWNQGDTTGVKRACRTYSSSLALSIEGILTLSGARLSEIKEHVAAVAGREIDDLYERLAPFSIIGAIAPLLGLLGTMIGMIEAFQLVSIFGDDGGAAMLAGSISKALITTALGLVIAVPSIMLYFYFKRKVHRYSLLLEEEIEGILLQWFDLEGNSRLGCEAPPQEEDSEEAELLTHLPSHATQEQAT